MYISPVCCIYIHRYDLIIDYIDMHKNHYICKTYQKMNNHVLKKVLLFTHQTHK